jgi:hypothetical protein
VQFGEKFGEVWRLEKTVVGRSPCGPTASGNLVVDRTAMLQIEVIALPESSSDSARRSCRTFPPNDEMRDSLSPLEVSVA